MHWQATHRVGARIVMPSLLDLHTEINSLPDVPTNQLGARGILPLRQPSSLAEVIRVILKCRAKAQSAPSVQLFLQLTSTTSCLVRITAPPSEADGGT